MAAGVIDGKVEAAAFDEAVDDEVGVADEETAAAEGVAAGVRGREVRVGGCGIAFVGGISGTVCCSSAASAASSIGCKNKAQ